ncbi:hypothetical protein OPT61_g5023 [Boeremia exigua]|uniref:Uncharacterized protein n=1 Tax=Boeremia exigua TaxID=749465 RepID=A0ACC2IBX8_9PLEO|nr:hypothetical protein OPT61_g5023 [Boeremia exigua]
MTQSVKAREGLFTKLSQNFNGRLTYAVSIIALSQVNFGLEQGVFNNTQAMPAFTKRFGVYNARKQTYEFESYFLSIMASLPYLGFAFGLVTGNMLSAKIGRKKCFMVMCFYSILGILVCITSTTNKWQVVAGRIIANVYIGMELAIVPVTQSELVPAPVRGATVSTYQTGLLVGHLIAALICRGTGELAGDKSWRIPFGTVFLIPCLMLLTVWHIPESPRWLLMKGRPEEAMDNLRLLRQGKFSEDEIQQEYQEFQNNLEINVEKGKVMEIFQGKNLKRTLIVVGVNVFLQLTGQNFISIYGAIFIRSIGVVNPFTMTSANSAIGIVTVLAVQLLTDKFGRVPLMATGALIQCGSLFTMGGLGTQANPSYAAKAGIVSMVTVFTVGFQIGWAPLSHVISAEIPSQRNRDATYALGSICNIAIQFAVSFSIPYLLNEPYAGLGSRVGFIFGSTAVLALLFTVFCIPECKGKTLEEIDELFLEGVPLRKFGKTGAVEHREVVEVKAEA